MSQEYANFNSLPADRSTPGYTSASDLYCYEVHDEVHSKQQGENASYNWGRPVTLCEKCAEEFFTDAASHHNPKDKVPLEHILVSASGFDTCHRCKTTGVVRRRSYKKRAEFQQFIDPFYVTDFVNAIVLLAYYEAWASYEFVWHVSCPGDHDLVKVKIDDIEEGLLHKYKILAGYETSIVNIFHSIHRHYQFIPGGVPSVEDIENLKIGELHFMAARRIAEHLFKSTRESSYQQIRLQHESLYGKFISMQRRFFIEFLERIDFIVIPEDRVKRREAADVYDIENIFGLQDTAELSRENADVYNTGCQHRNRRYANLNWPWYVDPPWNATKFLAGILSMRIQEEVFMIPQATLEQLAKKYEFTL